MGLKEKISELIAQEIKLDPMGIGYADKTDDEINVLLNSGVLRSATNYWTDQTPISRVLNGVGNAPNICEVTDVTLAQTVDIKPIEEPLEEPING
jgi:hypothetical protein